MDCAPDRCVSRRSVPPGIDGAVVSSGAVSSYHAICKPHSEASQSSPHPRLATIRPALAGTKGVGMGEPDFVHDFEQARRLHGALWAAGDYTRVAEQLTEVSAAVVNAAGVLPGMRVLDMGAGSGNTAGA